MGDYSLLSSVTAYVMFYDGSQWIHPDIANGLQCIPESQHLSSVQLIRSNHELMFRIVAVRNWDSKRLVNQQIFPRLKYKETNATFHQWRSENKQVIGLNFTSDQDAKRFYLAVRQILDNAGNFPQHQHPTDPTYQDPHYQSANYAQEMCMMQQQQYDSTLKMNNNNNNKIIMAGNMQQQQTHQNNSIHHQHQQQQGLLRRASQGSTISSSTGGSGQGQIYAPISIVQQSNSHPAQCNGGSGDVPPAAANCAMTQHSNSAAQLVTNSTSNGCSRPQQQQNQPKMAPIASAAPPPPPPPPPDLKNLLAAKQPPSFADQLRHVRLKKNSTGDGTQGKAVSPSNSVGSSNSNGPPSGPTPTKFQTGNNQDLLNELADRLSKRKMNVEASTSASTANRPPAVQPNNLKNAVVNSIAASHRKVPSGSSLSSQEEPISNSIIAGLSAGDPSLINRQQQQQNTITLGDLERVKAELNEEFARELTKLKQEITQTIREEIAKLTNALR